MDLVINKFKSDLLELSQKSGLSLLVLCYILNDISVFFQKQAEFQITLNNAVSQMNKSEEKQNEPILEKPTDSEV